MEMWQLGISADRARIALLVVLMIPVLTGLSHFCGFEATFDWRDDLVDAFVAFAVAFFAAGLVLSIFGEIKPGMPMDEIVCKLSLQAVCGSVGALLAEGQFAIKDEKAQPTKEPSSYLGELFLMLVGALFLALNVAPTEEIFLTAYRMSPIAGLLLVLASMVIMHGFVYAVGFSGQHEMQDDTPHWNMAFRFTIPGYAIALLICFYLLWTFGRLDGTSLKDSLMACIVLSFPASIGAATARLII